MSVPEQANNTDWRSDKLSILVLKEKATPSHSDLFPSQDDILADMKRTIEEFKKLKQQSDPLMDILSDVPLVEPPKIPEYRGRNGKVLPYYVRKAMHEKKSRQYEDLHKVLNAVPNLNI